MLALEIVLASDSWSYTQIDLKLFLVMAIRPGSGDFKVFRR